MVCVIIKLLFMQQWFYLFMFVNGHKFSLFLIKSVLIVHFFVVIF